MGFEVFKVIFMGCSSHEIMLNQMKNSKSILVAILGGQVFGFPNFSKSTNVASVGRYFTMS